MMSTFRRIGTLAAVVLMAACSGEPTTAPVAAKAPEAPTAKVPDAPSGSLLGSLLNLDLVANVQRTTPLAAPITVTQTIGSAGGTLSIPAAGVTVTVPAGAVSSNTVFTMTARAGSALAYDFAPHGITFAKPLTLTQKLSGTNAGLLTIPFLKLGYYSDPSLIGSVFSLVSELIGGTTNILSWSFSAPIKHFSGYMISCGRGGRDDD